MNDSAISCNIYREVSKMVVQLISQDILAAVTMKVTHFEFKVED
jgi:hypothetical protein